MEAVSGAKLAARREALRIRKGKASPMEIFGGAEEKRMEALEGAYLKGRSRGYLGRPATPPADPEEGRAYLKGYRGGERAARGKPEPCPEPSYAVPPADCHHLRCDCAERGVP